MVLKAGAAGLASELQIFAAVKGPVKIMHLYLWAVDSISESQGDALQEHLVVAVASAMVAEKCIKC